jgi:ribosomal protein S18 acetylase RimI-like enzyme
MVALAELINMAGEGLPEYLWRRMAAAGEDPWELGRQRQAQKAEGGQVYVIDEGAGAIAALMGYPVPAEPQPVAADELPAIVPLIELENLAPATWYVNVLAAYPEQRGRGLGSRLLALSEEIARDQGLSATSLIVASANQGARRLYERLGYAETARRAIVKDGWECDSADWVLMIRAL